MLADLNSSPAFTPADSKELSSDSLRLSAARTLLLERLPILLALELECLLEEVQVLIERALLGGLLDSNFLLATGCPGTQAASSTAR